MMSTALNYSTQDQPIRPADPSYEVKFETNRLRIRKLDWHDLKDFQKLVGDQEVMEYVTGKAYHSREGEAKLKTVIEAYNKHLNDYWMWAVEDKLSKQFIGVCLIYKNSKEEEELGIRLQKEFWGKGYGFELAKGLMRHAIKTMRFKCVKAYVDTRNTASEMIFLSCGFKPEAEHQNELKGKDRVYVYRRC
ncbi:GNAT family N-acetyltransferase [Persicobacter diffluens]|uniref:N-acetyltransferase n=1 Tax=Persicobacter diffluens TaxID=981 RepID=A0AAN4VUX4_9BACT|nr:N-acetyltransferase [Persicobacter diffluens]